MISIKWSLLSLQTHEHCLTVLRSDDILQCLQVSDLHGRLRVQNIWGFFQEFGRLHVSLRRNDIGLGNSFLDSCWLQVYLCFLGQEKVVDENVLYKQTPSLDALLHISFNGIGNKLSLLKEILEGGFADDSSHGWIWHLGNEIPNFSQIVSQLVKQLVGVYCSEENSSLDSQGHVVLSNHCLGLQVQYVCFQIDFDHRLCPRVNNMKSRLNDRFESSETL